MLILILITLLILIRILELTLIITPMQILILSYHSDTDIIGNSPDLSGDLAGDLA